MSTATELLRRALESLEYQPFHKTTQLIVDIRAFLAVEPEAEPVAWIFKVGDVLKGYPVVFIKTTTDKNFAYSFSHYDVKPLYTRPEPAIRKPMTEEELDALTGNVDELTARIYKWGFRNAEKHHGIGGDDD